jgi:hypothetical protein
MWSANSCTVPWVSMHSGELTSPTPCTWPPTNQPPPPFNTQLAARLHLPHNLASRRRAPHPHIIAPPAHTRRSLPVHALHPHARTRSTPARTSSAPVQALHCSSPITLITCTIRTLRALTLRTLRTRSEPSRTRSMSRCAGRIHISPGGAMEGAQTTI